MRIGSFNSEMTFQENPTHVRRTTEADWEAYRGLRLEMLQNSPLAFGETLANAQQWGEPEWRMRAARGEVSDQILVAAIDKADDRWVGTMGGFIANGPDVTGALLVGVYVTPTHRGAGFGVAVALLAEVEKWAATVGDSLSLHVHEDNKRALAFYKRSGYWLTGGTQPYALDAGQRELEMRKAF